MNDTLSQNLQLTEGIPAAGVRITILICAVFILAITMVIVYFKMKDADGINERK